MATLNPSTESPGLENVFEHIADAMVLVDRDWRFRYANPAVEALFRKDRRELLGRIKFEVFPQVVGTPSYALYQKAMHEQVPVQFEEYHPAQRAWIEIRAFPSQGGLAIFFRDITDRKRAELAWQLQKPVRFDAIAESAPDAIARFDRQLRHLYVNPAVVEITQIPAERFMGKTNRELGLPEHLCVLWEQAIARAFTGQLEQIVYDFEFASPTGIRSFQASIFPERGPGGSIESVVSLCRDVTELRKNQNALRESEEYHRQSINGLPLFIWSCKPGGEDLDFNERWLDHTQTKSANWLDAVHPDDRPAVRQSWNASLADGTEFKTELRIHRASDNTWRWHDARATLMGDADNRRWLGSMFDVHDLKQMQLLEAEQHHVLELVATTRPISDILPKITAMAERQLPGCWAESVVLDEGNLSIDAPSLPADLQAAIRKHSLQMAAQLSAQSASESDPLIVTDIANSSIDPEARRSAAHHGLKTTWSIPLRATDNTTLGLLVIYSRDSRPPNAQEKKVLNLTARLACIAIQHDQNSRQLDHFVRHDTLTGLPNRVLYESRVQQALSLARRNHRIVGLLALDLDHFKSINDSLGHEAGDQLLQQFATRSQSELRDSDTLARIGGDEFMLLLPEINTPEDAAIIARRILQQLTRPFLIADQERTVTSSIGIAIYPKDGESIEELQRSADAAMYESKRAGRNRFTLSSPKP